MSTTPKDGLMCSPCSLRKQQPSISAHGFDANCANAKSGSPRMATSQLILRIAEPGVADVCGQMATFTSYVLRAAKNALGMRTSGGRHSQNNYDGAGGITRKSRE